jgi:hypothetical protein
MFGLEVPNAIWTRPWSIRPRVKVVAKQLLQLEQHRCELLVVCQVHVFERVECFGGNACVISMIK